MSNKAAEHAVLVERTFRDMFADEVLPSGIHYALMPDTIETAIRVAEISDSKTWKRKALEAFTVVKSVGGHDVQAAGPGFIHQMLDTDVTFLALAWTAQMGGMALELEQGAPCPSCGNLWKRVDFGDLKCRCLPSPVGGPDGIYEIPGIEDSMLPKSLKGCKLYLTAPTWHDSRKNLTEAAWESPEAVTFHRVLAALRASASDGGAPRALSIESEAKQIRSIAIPKIVKALDGVIPNFKMTLDLTCERCGEVARIPFSGNS